MTEPRTSREKPRQTMREIVASLGCGKRVKSDVCGKYCYLCTDCAPKYYKLKGMAAMTEEIKSVPRQFVRHKIGSTRTIQTAILVCEYLRRALGRPHSNVHPDQIRYYSHEPTDKDGFWTADIIVEAHELSIEDSLRFVNICRAFVAGRGEIWT